MQSCNCCMFEGNAAALQRLAELNPLCMEVSEGGSGTERTAGKRTTAGGGKSVGGNERLGGEWAMEANPAWIAKRLERIERIKEKNAAAIAGLDKPAITVTLPDGKQMPGVAFETTPLDIAGALSKGLMQAVCVSSVRYSNRLKGVTEIIEMATGPDDDVPAVEETKWETWDASRPLEGDCELQLLKFDDPRGKEVFWHSTAHMLGQALETEFSARLTHGPPLENGFFYDSYLGGGSYSESMKATVEKKVTKITSEKQEFHRVVVTKEEALELFADNPFKLSMINSKLPDGSSTTVYQNGPFVDLCRGPHIANTGRVKAFTTTKNSASLWLGKQGNDQLQRVYGISFPDKKEMTEWKHLQEEAAKRDHRKIGLEQELFYFDELSPGSCFFLPHGTRLYNKLIETIRGEYWKRNYLEVVTPNMYNLKLWETSGHATKYKENMFCFPIEGQEFGLKPMNCPGHCLMFKHRKRSYRELPMRLCDFGVLHRNELSGALTGLTRVRRFQQDDAHIFCMVSQIKAEVAGVLDMIATVYGFLGMSFALKLSTRPENFLGEVEVWDKAEALMTEALNEYSGVSGHAWSLNPGDGAFYGPHRRAGLRRAQEAPPVRDGPARLRAADALRPQVPGARQPHRGGRGRGGRGGRRAREEGGALRAARDDPPRRARLGRADDRHPDRALRRQVALLPLAAAGAGRAREQDLHRLRARGAEEAQRRRLLLRRRHLVPHAQQDGARVAARAVQLHPRRRRHRGRGGHRQRAHPRQRGARHQEHRRPHRRVHPDGGRPQVSPAPRGRMGWVSPRLLSAVGLH